MRTFLRTERPDDALRMEGIYSRQKKPSNAENETR